MVISPDVKSGSKRAMQRRSYDFYRPDSRTDSRNDMSHDNAPGGSSRDLIRNRDSSRGGGGKDLFDKRPPPAQSGHRQDEAMASSTNKHVPTGPAADRREEDTTKRAQKQTNLTMRDSQKGVSRNAEGKLPDELFRRFVSAISKRIRLKQRSSNSLEKEARLKDDLDRCNKNDAEFLYAQRLISSQREKVNNDYLRDCAEIQKTDTELKGILESWEARLSKLITDRVIKQLSTSKSPVDTAPDGHGDPRADTAFKKDLEQMKEAFEVRFVAMSNQCQGLRQDLEAEKQKNSSFTNQLQRVQQDLEKERDRVNSYSQLPDRVERLEKELQGEKQKTDRISKFDQRFQKLQKDIEAHQHMTSSLPTLVKQSEGLQHELVVERDSRLEFGERVKGLEQELKAKDIAISTLGEQCESLLETQATEKERSDNLERKISQLVSQASEAKPDSRDEAETMQIRQSRRQSTNRSTEASPGPMGFSTAVKVEEANTPITRTELDKALKELDDTISSAKDSNKLGRKTARTLRSVMADLKLVESHNDHCELQSSVNKLRETVEALQPTVQEQADENAALKSKIESLAAGGAPTAPTSNLSFSMEDVKQVVATEVSKGIRDAIPRIKERLDRGLGDEASKRERLENEMKKAVADSTALGGQINSIKSQVETLLQTLPDGGQQSKELKSLAQQTATWKDTTLRDIDELSMQCQNLKAWQDTFSTRPMCQEIVDHINATLPNGLQRQINALLARVDQLERTMSLPEVGGLKRRRVEEGTPPPARGAQ